MNDLSHKWIRLTFAAIATFFLVAVIAAFCKRPIHNDEAWIGQQVWSLLTDGVVVSDLFGDSPPLDQEIVVYHKQLVWVGVAVSELFGWGLLPLRAISLVSGLLLLLLVGTAQANSPDRRQELLTVIILMLTPIFWLQLLEFRPEALLLLCGTASFLLLKKAVAEDRLLLVVLAALLAGMAGLCHAFGFAFVIAGVATAVVERRFRMAVLFAIIGIAAFSPYFSGYFSDRELFLQQTLQNPLMTTSFEYHWWSPIANLLTEHKRILRKPEVIGITVMFMLALAPASRAFLRRHRFTLVYLLVLFVVLGISPLPKFTRYMIPMVPLMALICASGILEYRAPMHGARAILRIAFYAWCSLFVASGIHALVFAAIQPSQGEINTNSVVAERMQPGTLVMAPFDFVFEQQGSYTIRNFWGASRIFQSKDPATLERYAESLGVRYLILDPTTCAEWGIDPDSADQSLSHYQLVLALPNRHRSLFEFKQ